MKLLLVSLFGGFANAITYNAIPGFTCGVKNLNDVFGPRDTPIQHPLERIVGGDDAELGQYPWQARFIPCSAQNSQCYMCGATLISDYWLVTAAHCVDGDVASNIPPSIAAHSFVNVGTLSGTDGWTYTLAEIIMHESWSGSGVVGFDIAMLKTDTVVTLNHDVYPACLPKQTECFRADSESWVSGYGALAYGGQNADSLQGVMLPLVPHSSCTAIYGSISTSTVCAGWQQGGMDSCQGDSGGPMATLSDDIWYFYGVVSFGYQCAVPGIPGVYTRITDYVDWIIQKTVDDGDWPINADYALDGTPSCLDADDPLLHRTDSGAFDLTTTAPVTTDEPPNTTVPPMMTTTVPGTIMGGPMMTTAMSGMDVLITSTAEMVELFYETQNDGVNATTTILMHGCYCSALNGMMSLAGIWDDSVSNLDDICHYNRRCKNCGHRDAFTDSGLFCDGVDAPWNYTVTVMEGAGEGEAGMITCDEMNNDCQFAHCECDLKISKDLYAAQMMDDSMIETSCPNMASEEEAGADITFAPPTTNPDGQGMASTGPPGTGEPVITEMMGMADECCGMLPYYIQYNSFLYPSYTCETDAETGMPYVADDGTAVHTFMWPEDIVQ